MNYPRRRSGFTLVELLTVIAIIGILATALVPAIGAVRRKARAATAQSAFTQWANGIVRYKTTYGFYPNVGASYNTSTDSLHLLESGTVGLNFVKCLYGKAPNATALATADRTKYNRNSEEFVSFAKDDYLDFTANTASACTLVDRFGNSSIRVIFDTDNTGTIKNISTGFTLPADITAIGTATGMPAKVIIYTSPLEVTGSTGLSAGDVLEVVVIQ